MHSSQPLHRRPRGLKIVGPGFYLWDPDAREALRLAAELSRRSHPVLVRRQPASVRRPVA